MAHAANHRGHRHCTDGQQAGEHLERAGGTEEESGDPRARSGRRTRTTNRCEESCTDQRQADSLRIRREQRQRALAVKTVLPGTASTQQQRTDDHVERAASEEHQRRGHGRGERRLGQGGDERHGAHGKYRDEQGELQTRDQRKQRDARYPVHDHGKQVEKIVVVERKPGEVGRLRRNTAQQLTGDDHVKAGVERHVAVQQRSVGLRAQCHEESTHSGNRHRGSDKCKRDPDRVTPRRGRIAMRTHEPDLRNPNDAEGHGERNGKDVEPRELKNPEKHCHRRNAQWRGDCPTFKPVQPRKCAADHVTRGEEHQEQKPGDISHQSGDRDPGNRERGDAPG